MEPPSAAPQDSPPYDTQLSFYGPGALACWYLALLCALLTWALHATDRFTHLKLTPDIAFYALYACLAAGHMAVQISRFSDDDIRRMCDAKGLGWNDTRYHDIDVLRGMEPGLREMVAGLNVAFRVAVCFHWVASCVLVVVGFSKRIWPDRMKGARRQERGLPWVMAVSEAWVLGCFAYLAARCGVWTVVVAFLDFTFWMGILVFGSAVLVFAVLWTALSVLGVTWYQFRPEVQEAWRKARVHGVRSGAEAWSWFVRLLAMLFLLYVLVVDSYTLYIAGRMVALWGFPELGVSITGLDQSLAMCTGFVATGFMASSVFRSRFSNWEVFGIWVTSCWYGRALEHEKRA